MMIICSSREYSTDKNLANYIHKLLDRYGFSYVWANKETSPSLHFLLPLFLQTASDVHQQQSLSQINNPNSNKFNFYRTVKSQCFYEDYLDAVTIPAHRIALSKLRISDHKLGVETGRYKNIPFVDRKCEHCILNQIDDEHHYITACTRNAVTRINLQEKVLTLCKSKNYENIFSNPAYVSELGKFVHLSNQLSPK